ncbi:MAG TPA: peroxiredoxin [Microlunatus sp.]
MTLRVGDVASAFATRNQHGQPVDLADLRGRPAVLVFYPWAFSGICTGELSGLRDAAEQFEDADVRIVAISCDAMFSLRVYAETEALPFDLLTDHWPHGEIARAYGVFDEQAGCALRGSFVLDPAGRITWSVVNQIGEARDIAAHLAAVQAA